MRWLALVLLAACGDSTAPAASAAAPQTSDATAVPDAAVVTPASTCPAATTPASVGHASSADIDEASGIAASTLNPGVFWTHNDSGDSARAFALSGTGQLLATLKFDTAPAVDIEDMAIEDAADGSYLYFADIGDNDSVRSSYVIHRVKEPRVGGSAAASITAQSEKMTVHYPDGAHNAETLLFDPVTKDLVIATKVLFGSSAIHRVGPFVAGSTVTTTKIGSVPIALADGGAISRDGRRVAIRNYGTTASMWVRNAGEPLATMFARQPCSIPIANEPQGEAFAFLADDHGYVTISEGQSPSINVAHLE